MIESRDSVENKMIALKKDISENINILVPPTEALENDKKGK